MYWFRSNFEDSPAMSFSCALRLVKTPIELSTSQITAEATTVAIAKATDSRKDSFIADHGSIRATVSLTLRGPEPGVGWTLVARPCSDGPLPGSGRCGAICGVGAGALYCDRPETGKGPPCAGWGYCAGCPGRGY